MIRAHLFVEGRVQGVFFRYETKEKAIEKRVKGWVRNLGDGRVEVLFEGEKDRVEELIEWCHRGPFGAKVRKVDVSIEEIKEQTYPDFSIRYWGR